MRLRCDQVFGDFRNAGISEIQEILPFRLKPALPYYFGQKVDAYSVLIILGKIVILLEKLDSIKHK